MKSLLESMQLDEAHQNTYRAELIGARGSDGLPISVTILVDREDVKGFEKYAEDEEGNTFSHIEGGNIEY